MKKILLALAALGLISTANAAATSTPLTLAGSLQSNCNAGFSAPTLTFVFTPGTQTAPQETLYNLSCTAGSIITAFTATSSNGWQFKGGTSNDLIPYTIPGVTVAAPYVGLLVPLWSAAPGVTAATPLLTGGTPITIGTAAEILTATLPITPGLTPAGTNVDPSYADTVTIATAY